MTSLEQAVETDELADRPTALLRPEFAVEIYLPLPGDRVLGGAP